MDSEEAVCGLLDEIFSQQGYKVVSVTGPDEAIARAKESFDLMFVGLRMAKEAGLELVKAVKERSPATSIVVMTGLDTQDIIADALTAGVDRVLLKPFEVDEALALASELAQAKRPALPKVS
ncbi:MAG: response regulator [Chloroflexi bacterium]|nr:response regulator [Chloroflexota bacterium]